MTAARSTLSDVQLAQVRRLLAPVCRVPPHAQAKLEVVCRYSGTSVEVVERRPDWRGGPDWIEHPVAKFRYVKAADEWRLFCRFRDGKWRAYEPHPSAKDLTELVDELESDPTGIFWG